SEWASGTTKSLVSRAGCRRSGFGGFVLRDRARGIGEFGAGTRIGGFVLHRPIEMSSENWDIRGHSGTLRTVDMKGGTPRRQERQGSAQGFGTVVCASSSSVRPAR